MAVQDKFRHLSSLGKNYSHEMANIIKKPSGANFCNSTLLTHFSHRCASHTLFRLDIPYRFQLVL